MRLWLVLTAAALAWLPLEAAAQDAVHAIPEFTFESGEKLANMKVGYATHGKLNEARSNAILVTHGASGIRTGNAPLIGPGKAYDTDKYFVITVDAIGGGNSSQPKDGLGTKFPKYTIRDMVRAQHDLLTKGLGLSRVIAIGGPSMGAQQALEWGIHYPDFMDRLLLIVPGARSDRHVRAIFDAVETAIKLDPKYQDGNYTAQPRDGIILGGMIYFPWLYSDEHLATITDEVAWEKASRAFGTAWANAWDANSLLSRYHAASRFDPSTPFGGDLGKALAQGQGQDVDHARHDRPYAADLSGARALSRHQERDLRRDPELSRPPCRRARRRGERRVRVRDRADQEFSVVGSSQLARIPLS
jgi:homoserine O-acetyltransferase